MHQRNALPLVAPLLLLVPLACAGSPGEPTPAPARPAPTPVPTAPAPRTVVADGARGLTSADELLGVALGTRLAAHEEVLELWRRWERESARVVLRPYGRTAEGRELVVGIVSSEANIARLDAILADQRRLADPRGLADAERDALCRDTPALAYLGCSIHGDETSGVDAGLALAERLIGAEDGPLAQLLDELVVVIDPCMNPDGRERFRAMVAQNSGRVPSLDADSVSHGRWPRGRGNHYLFDMNRDWMTGVAPETRGRWSVLRDMLPQLFVDAHEMGSHDTFLFYPQAAPHNPRLPASHVHWQTVFGAEQARAFDARGWSYYTREWADAWGPFYSDAWGSLQGGVGLLYEQASYSGQPLLRPSGEVVTYAEAVEHQLTSFEASLAALREHREAVLRDFTAHRAAACDAREVCVIRPGASGERLDWLAERLAAQGIEVWRAARDLELGAARGALDDEVESLAAPAGSLVVPAGQPAGALVHAFLDFDVRVDDETLLDERRRLERDAGSRMYDVTSWSLAHALDLDAWWCDAVDAEALEPWVAPEVSAGVTGPAGYGWVVDGADDASLAFAVHALDAGLAVHAADEPFECAGRSFARGSLLVRRHEHAQGVEERVDAAARAAGVTAVACDSARAPADGHDLGGGHFDLLERPRVALLSGGLTSPDDFGHLWHHLDVRLGLQVSLFETTELASHDLRRFNVLIVPPGYGALGATLEASSESLRAWVAGGGTLIGVGDSAALLADAKLGLSDVRRREEVLAELAAYEDVARRQLAARDVRVDPALVWGDAEAPEPEAQAQAPEPAADTAELEREDRWQRRFMPLGATLLGLVDERSWISAGARDRMGVLSPRGAVLLTPAEVHCPVRLADADSLRLSGLVWPEARERLAHAAWLTVERRGNGQVILFAAPPAFRGYHLGTARLFANAVVLGPGLGARAPLPR